MKKPYTSSVCSSDESQLNKSWLGMCQFYAKQRERIYWIYNLDMQTPFMFVMASCLIKFYYYELHYLSILLVILENLFNLFGSLIDDEASLVFWLSRHWTVTSFTEERSREFSIFDPFVCIWKVFSRENPHPGQDRRIPSSQKGESSSLLLYSAPKMTFKKLSWHTLSIDNHSTLRKTTKKPLRKWNFPVQ